MDNYYPFSKNLPALEQNILKYRSFEMMLVLFKIQDLKRFVLESINATDEMHYLLEGTAPRLTKGTKNLYKKVWAILVDDGILTQDESDDLQAIIDYRNDIAHCIEDLTCDIGRNKFNETYVEMKGVRYDYSILRKLEHYRRKIDEGMGKKYTMSLSFCSDTL